MHEKYLYDFQQFGTSSGLIFKMKQYLNSEINLLCIGRITFFKKQLVNKIFDIEHIENFVIFKLFFLVKKMQNLKKCSDRCTVEVLSFPKLFSKFL